MKQLLTLAALSLLLVGCGSWRPTPASPAETAYKVLAATAHTVDAAMKGWADFVVAGMASAKSEEHARMLYNNYQSLAQLAGVQISQLSNGTPAAELDLTLKSVESAAGQLTEFIWEQKKAKQ